jgi:hypothetical protein
MLFLYYIKYIYWVPVTKSWNCAKHRFQGMALNCSYTAGSSDNVMELCKAQVPGLCPELQHSCRFKSSFAYKIIIIAIIGNSGYLIKFDS